MRPRRICSTASSTCWSRWGTRSTRSPSIETLPASAPFRVGLNPYGLAYTAGLQGFGTDSANPRPLGLRGFIALARDFGAACVELDHRWLVPLSDTDLAHVGRELAGMTPVCSFWLSHQPGETLAEAIRCTRGVGGGLIRFHLTPVLEGARASWGARWSAMGAHAREVLAREAPRVADAGLALAIEDHQDFGSEELLALTESLGPHVGIVLDTGNPFSVAEDPVEFARRAAPRIRHVHLKDYVAQFTPEGYRLIRCAIGAGAVPFGELAALLGDREPALTASLEPGALEARHIRLFTRGWWDGYPPRAASELGIMLGRLRKACLPDDADYRTPWERGASAAEIVEYEMRELRESVAFVKAQGWVT